MLYILSVVLSGVVGGWLYRWRGGGWPVDHIPRLIKTAVCAIPYALVLYLTTNQNLAATLVAWLFSWFFFFQGHGAYQDAGRNDILRPNHKPQEYIGKYQEEDFVRILREAFPSGEIFGRRDFYEFLAMGFTGFLVTFIPGVLITVLISPFLGVLLSLSGFTKGLGYAASYLLFKKTTALGEFLAGTFLYSTLAGIYLLT